VFREGPVEVVATLPMLIAAGIEAVMDLGYGAFLGFGVPQDCLNHAPVDRGLTRAG